MPAPRRRIPGGFRAVIYAVLVHVVVIAVLIIGFRWSDETAAPVGEPMQAVAVEDPAKRKQEEEKKQRQAEEEQRREEEARKKEEEKQRLAEQKQAEQKQEEQRRLEQEARKKEETEKKRIAEQKKQEEERKRKDAERKKVEADKKRAEQQKKEEQESRRKAAEEGLKQQVAAEEQARLEAARAARAASEADKYKALIRQKVSRNWNRPPGAATGLKCQVRVRLTPGGEVLQASVVRSSGDPVFDRSVENAVYKAAPLPIPPDPDLFDYFREIEFLFSPEA